MGTFYSVELRIKFKNESSKTQAHKDILDYVTTTRTANYGIDGYSKISLEELTNDFEKVIALMLAESQEEFYVLGKDKLGYSRYSSGFNASYGWELELRSFFEVISPYLMNRSNIRIETGEGLTKLTIKNDDCVRIK